MELTELFNKGVIWAMNNPIGRSAFAKLYREKTGKEACMSCPADIYKKYFELKKLTENNNG
jgi:hypothetical protein